VQQRRGATTLAVSRDSLVIEGSVDEWQQWCSMAFPATGDYVIAGGQSLLQIDRESDRGVYSEAHVWMQLPGRPA
jgi:hypothetical protein